MSWLIAQAQKALKARRDALGIGVPLSTGGKRPSDPIWIGRCPTVDEKPRRPLSIFARIAPGLAAYCLDPKHGRLSAYRLNKVMQALDIEGRGWMQLTEVQAFVVHDPRHRMYGRRRLTKVLAEGEGFFWRRVKARGEIRIRLMARSRIVAAAGLVLRGNEVKVELGEITGSGSGRLAEVAAIFYATFHAGRRREAPISRAALEGVTGCSPYRQRSYERKSGTVPERQFSLLCRYSDYELRRARFREMPAFRFVDYRGIVNRGKPGLEYVAVSLPNIYRASPRLRPCGSGRQKKINQRAAVLCNLGSEGNGARRKIFHSHVRSAVRAKRADDSIPCYLAVGGGLWRRFF